MSKKKKSDIEKIVFNISLFSSVKTEEVYQIVNSISQRKKQNPLQSAIDIYGQLLRSEIWDKIKGKT